ncbi:MAG: hypothetical protein ACE5MI_09940, partial [Acidimicrobiia bacterium]
MRGQVGIAGALAGLALLIILVDLISVTSRPAGETAAEEQLPTAPPTSVAPAGAAEGDTATTQAPTTLPATTQGTTTTGPAQDLVSLGMSLSARNGCAVCHSA